MGEKDFSQYVVLKIPFNKFIKNSVLCELKMSDEESKKYMIEQDDGAVFNQLENLRGVRQQFVKEIIYLEAKHDKKKSALLRQAIIEGIEFNGIKYNRFGKSNSQAKDGITVFVSEEYYYNLMDSSMLGLNIKNTVISKFESYRNLIFSSTKLINERLPYIIIVGEYTKKIPNQFIRYVDREQATFETEDGEVKEYEKREIKEGYKDIEISPFDGCGCHSKEIGEVWKKHLGLEYRPSGYQIRLPLTKGESVEVEFKQWFYDNGITKIKDVFGNWHDVNKIDCIWNTTMWKGYKYFKEQHGDNAWNYFLLELNKYNHKLGISKYSHHIDNLDLKRRFNFQYLQTLDLINPNYIKKFKDNDFEYDILDKSNDGKIVSLARYSTDLFEKIINGDEFYSMKFLGITDTDLRMSNNNYLEAVKINKLMLKDPVIKNLLKNTTKKYINQMKFGKIYIDGFYHTIVGDMIAYLEYSAGFKDIIGVLPEWNVYIDTLDSDKATLFRSPCVCSSEIANVDIFKSDIIEKYMPSLTNQDIIMFSSNDILMPQLGGADADGDVCFVSINETIYNSKIQKPIIIDIEDKSTAEPEEYNIDNIVKYELNSRDSRIGEITNIATSILNSYTENEKWKKINDENISLLRIYQGKEIDFLKTGKRWVITRGLRKHLRRLPYFILHNYDKKMSVYLKRKNANRNMPSEARIQYNCFHSPSQMNELCDYIETWERKKIKWNNERYDTGKLLVSDSIEYSDKILYRKCREVNDSFSKEWTIAVRNEDESVRSTAIKDVFKKYRAIVYSLDESVSTETLANYLIKVENSRPQLNKHLSWELFGDIILENLKKKTNPEQHLKIVECDKNTNGAHEYLGKYYLLLEGKIGD